MFRLYRGSKQDKPSTIRIEIQEFYVVNYCQLYQKYFVPGLQDTILLEREKEEGKDYRKNCQIVLAIVAGIIVLVMIE